MKIDLSRLVRAGIAAAPQIIAAVAAAKVAVSAVKEAHKVDAR